MAAGKVYVTKRASFEAAHHLNNYEGPCSRVHGHSYKLEVTFVGYVDIDVTEQDFATDAMVCDFKVLKSMIKKVIGKYDHQDLNLFFDQPTAEIMCMTIFHELRNQIESSAFTIDSVKLWETEDSYVTYRGEC